MILLIGQVDGSELRRIRLERVTSTLISRPIDRTPSTPIAAVLQVVNDSHWVSTRGDQDFFTTLDDLGLSRLTIPASTITRCPRHLSVQALQGLNAAHHYVDVDHVVGLDDFDQAFFMVRMVAPDRAWIGRLQDPDFDSQLQALGLGQSKLNVDSLDQDAYLTGTTAG